jgi:hypothetical protein
LHLRTRVYSSSATRHAPARTQAGGAGWSEVGTRASPMMAAIRCRCPRAPTDEQIHNAMCDTWYVVVVKRLGRSALEGN